MFTLRFVSLFGIAGAVAASLMAAPAMAAHPPVSSGCGGGYIRSAPVYVDGYSPGVSVGVVIGGGHHHHAPPPPVYIHEHRPVYVAPHHGGHGYHSGGYGQHGGGHRDRHR